MSVHLPGPARPHVTDAGLETELVFHDGLDLPAFAAYPLLRDRAGRDRLTRYYSGFLDVAERHGVGMVLETPTWRTNPDWGAQLGDDAAALERVDREAVALVRALAAGRPAVPTVVSGTIGPRSDGYAPTLLMDAADAEAYHRPQVRAFAGAGVDLVGALTLGYAAEAIGLARAAAAEDVPITLAFTVETDGTLPSGQPLGDAIAEVDAATGASAAYLGVNCAHPTHLAGALDGPWAARIGTLRCNASARSHAELDEATELDDGDPEDLARRCAALREHLPGLAVLGGCCGTDLRHVAAMWEAWDPRATDR